MNEKALPVSPSPSYKTLNDFDRDMVEHLLLDVEPDEKMDINSQNLLVSYDFDCFKIESITTRRSRKLDTIYDEDCSSGGPADGLILYTDNSRLTSWTEKVRLISTNMRGLRWVDSTVL